MAKRLTLLDTLQALPPTSNAEACLHFSNSSLIADDIARQRQLWQAMEEMLDEGESTLDLGLFDEEPSAIERLAGCDEVGRGPLAGPLVTAAVILPPGAYIPGLRDSKQLSHEERLAMVPWIQAQALAYAVVEIGLDELNAPTANINALSLEGMTRALDQLSLSPSFVLVDGRHRLPRWNGPQQALIKGDDRCPAIAAASVLAKVHRDLLMIEADKTWPQYGFGEHKGYGTAQHMQALRQHGICPLHRTNYRPIAELLQ